MLRFPEAVSPWQLTHHLLKTLSDDKILDQSKLKVFADDNFKFDKNG